MLFSCKEENDNTAFYYPAEWESHQAIYIGWGYEAEWKREAWPFIIDIVYALNGTTPIIFLSDTSENVQVLKDFLLNKNISPDDYEFISLPMNNPMAPRDIGPVYLLNGRGEKKVVDFKWAAQEAYKEFLIARGIEASKAAEYASFLERNQKVDSILAIKNGHEVISSCLTLDGGAIEVNGKGTILLNEYWMLKYNNGIPKDSIENELRRTLNVSNFVWVGKGLMEDPPDIATIIPGYFGAGTDGHTDEYIRFANATTILLAWVDENERDKHPINKGNYERLNETFQILKQAKDQNGQPFNIIKLPLPDLIYRPVVVVEGWATSDTTVGISLFTASDGYKVGDTITQVAASSYLNFLVSNDKVLLPTYLHVGGSKEKEEEVKRIFTKLYPDKDLVWIDAMKYNWEGGGIHCFTKQVPLSTNFRKN
ncbi:agmatine/peptidylarginine deiminase [Belliella kenyensis]|uniref:Agmatine/peptidylarginine deiminase n=1 Tax=Belliella kenyensis TaxID=1472724 RepID=A0ABV8ELX7_9BACT|nr:agmatine deiminase family protein [Belliella kenyensis]MDN3602976.1 agmatine deiminase family protein [Belliella kenyensis]